MTLGTPSWALPVLPDLWPAFEPLVAGLDAAFAALPLGSEVDRPGEEVLF